MASDPVNCVQFTLVKETATQGWPKRRIALNPQYWNGSKTIHLRQLESFCPLCVLCLTKQSEAISHHLSLSIYHWNSELLYHRYRNDAVTIKYGSGIKGKCHNCLSECRFVFYNERLAKKDLNKTNKQTNKWSNKACQLATNPNNGFLVFDFSYKYHSNRVQIFNGISTPEDQFP